MNIRAVLVLAVYLLLMHPASSAEVPDRNYFAQRKRLVEEVKEMGVRDEDVLKALSKVPRHLFIPEGLRTQAYRNHPLPIGEDQTISQPYVVAYMTEALKLKETDKVLEIGTGSGYQAAVLAELVKKVYSIEIIKVLGKRAEMTLKKSGYDNVEVRIGDGYRGWPEKAPFDAIIITAAPPEIPDLLIKQLKEGGRLIVPVGSYTQNLILLTRKNGIIQKRKLLPVIFVPMTGKAQELGN
jgi:protein-L-isoaspartate(D-aspartate) O-methyltransferase